MSEKESRFFQKRRLHILLIIFLGLLVYSNTFDAPFQFDDYLFLNYREIVSQATKAFSGLQVDTEATDSISLPAGVYRGPWASRPLLYATFVLNELMGEFNTWGYHIVNIALHIGNSILLYFLVVLTGKHLGYEEKKSIPVALLSSILFVLHPVQTETVTNIINRSMLMATTFYLAGLLFFLKIATSEGREKKYYTAGLLLSALLGAASREDFATFPLMLVLYDLFFLSHFRIRELSRHYKGYAAILPGIALMGYLSLTNTYDRSIEFTDGNLPQDIFIAPLHYALTQLKIHWTYIRLFLLPINQNLDHNYQISKTIYDIPTMLSFAGYIGLWACGLLLARKKPAASFGILWFVIVLLPISFAITVFGLRLGDPIFEHRLYLPSVGLIVLAALGLAHLTHSRRYLTSVIIIIFLLLGSATYARNYIWTDEGRLWEDVIAKSPKSSRGHNNLATYLYEHGLYDKAIEHLETALKYWPDNHNFYGNMGNVYFKKGNIEKSIEYFETALKLHPSLPDTHSALGMTYMMQNKYEKALDHFLAAADLSPWDATPSNNAAMACYALGRKEDAIKHYISSLWIDRKQVKVLHNISVLYMETGQTERAIEHLEALVSFVPGHLPAHLALGRLYMEKNQPLMAAKHLQEALKIRPDSPGVHRAIAKFYREVGNIQSADEHLKRAKALEKTMVSNATAIW